jgi:hypothetical protein
MYKFKKNKYEDSYAFLWDNTDETLEEVRDYLKEVKGEYFEACRSWNDETQKNDGDTLCISERTGTGVMTSFYRLNEYVVHVENGYFHGYKKLELERKNIVLEKI